MDLCNGKFLPLKNDEIEDLALIYHVYNHGSNQVYQLKYVPESLDEIEQSKLSATHWTSL